MVSKDELFDKLWPGQVRIIANLINATTGEHLWSEHYDRPLKNIFVPQGETVQKIATTLKLQLTLQEQGYTVRKRTANPEAYDTFLRGMESLTHNTKEAITVQARQMFEKALALDPQYAEAYALLGATYYLEWAFRYSTNPSVPESVLTLMQQALVLDDSLPIAHWGVSYVYAQTQQYDQALVEMERAIALDPNNADGHHAKAHVLNWAGRPDEAIEAMAQAMRLNPRYPPIYLFQLGWAYRLAGRYAEAVATMKEVLIRSPKHMASYEQLAICLVQQ